MNNIDIDKYNDINYLSSLLFDVLYNKKMERAVSIESVDIKDVKVSNILKNYEGAELTNLINSVFNRDITYLYKNIKKYTFKINDIVNKPWEKIDASKKENLYDLWKNFKN